MDLGEGFLLGAIGGVLTEVYGLYQLRKRSKSQRPAWVGSMFYWLITLLMIVIGGVVVALYIRSGAQLNPLIAIHLGAATPTLIGVFSKSSPDIQTAG